MLKEGSVLTGNTASAHICYGTRSERERREWLLLYSGSSQEDWAIGSANETRERSQKQLFCVKIWDIVAAVATLYTCKHPSVDCTVFYTCTHSKHANCPPSPSTKHTHTHTLSHTQHQEGTDQGRRQFTCVQLDVPFLRTILKGGGHA